MKKIVVSALIAAGVAMFVVRRISSKQVEQANKPGIPDVPAPAGSDDLGGMDMGDIENKAEELKGAAKDHIGDATDNEDMQAEGKAEKAKAEVKQAGENMKDAVKDTFDR
jgi:uncharacterized protein YjbJ (UPF0337 family)